jgi:hypothetical protein
MGSCVRRCPATARRQLRARRRLLWASRRARLPRHLRRRRRYRRHRDPGHLPVPAQLLSLPPRRHPHLAVAPSANRIRTVDLAWNGTISLPTCRCHRATAATQVWPCQEMTAVRRPMLAPEAVRQFERSGIVRTPPPHLESKSCNGTRYKTGRKKRETLNNWENVNVGGSQTRSVLFGRRALACRSFDCNGCTLSQHTSPLRERTEWKSVSNIEHVSDTESGKKGRGLQKSYTHWSFSMHRHWWRLEHKAGISALAIRLARRWIMERKAASTTKRVGRAWIRMWHP